MTTLKNDLTNLPNIGRTLAEKLKMVGISTPGDLINTGSENAIIKIKAQWPEPTFMPHYTLTTKN